MISLRNFLSDIFESHASHKERASEFFQRTEPSPRSLIPDQNTAQQLIMDLGSRLAALQCVLSPGQDDDALQGKTRGIVRRDFTVTSDSRLPGTVWVEFEQGQDRIYAPEDTRGRYLYPPQALEVNMLEIRILPSGKYEVTDYSTLEKFNERGHREHHRHKVHKDLDAEQVAKLLNDFAKRVGGFDIEHASAGIPSRSFMPSWDLPDPRSDQVTMRSSTPKL